ncbi:gamma-butyrobetaine dioxygenase-like [Haematobia irritans]|uniref:gamma-butyrobetaine dioxygenase-like n=1 Tax=Haematobia irritans TaxID=7368 RepID=UPI003F4F509F
MILTNQALKLAIRILKQPCPLSKSIRHLSAKAQEISKDEGSLAAIARGKDQMIYVRENDVLAQNQDMQFPSVWLRDNCRCDQCFHQDSMSRKPMTWTTNFDCDVKAEDIQINEATKEIHIQWSDNHQSTYPLQWLKERNFSKDHQETYMRSWYRPQPKYWSQQEFSKILKTFQYKDVMGNDAALNEWLETITIWGVSMLKDAPLETDVIKNLCNRIGFIRKTAYGEVFSVVFRSTARNYAYLSKPLPLHTDMPYCEYKPSVTILHTLEQSKSEGGSNMLTDAYNVANQLREQNPEYFQILSDTLVDWCDIGQDEGESFHNIFRAPVINLDKDGQYTRINFSIPQRDSHFNIDIDKVVSWYRANSLFVRMAHEQAVTFKTQPGDILAFNNLRVVHGRTGYDDSKNNVRHIMGAFVDWDTIHSKRRVLSKALEKDNF